MAVLGWSVQKLLDKALGGTGWVIMSCTSEDLETALSVSPLHYHSVWLLIKKPSRNLGLAAPASLRLGAKRWAQGRAQTPSAPRSLPTAATPRPVFGYLQHTWRRAPLRGPHTRQSKVTQVNKSSGPKQAPWESVGVLQAWVAFCNQVSIHHPMVE